MMEAPVTSNMEASRLPTPSTPRRRRRGRGAATSLWWVLVALGGGGRKVWAGQCVFRQTCVGGLDGNCTPEPTDSTIFPNGTFANASFPLDAAHGFGVAHDGVWNGDMADPGTGKCTDITADGLGAVPVVCPQYQGDGCCTWEQNYVLFQNLKTLVATFGGAQGCMACAVNLVNLWCGLICSPNQHSFQQLHDPPFDVRTDDLTNGRSRVLQVDVWLSPAYACAMYSSCKSTSIVGSVTGMQSGLGLLTYQAQTGAVGHGEYFLIHFDNDTTAAADGTSHSSSSASKGQQHKGKKDLFSLATLDCSAFHHPGSETVPFPYPTNTSQHTLTSCSCTYCQSSCSSMDVGVTTSDQHSPISPMAGFDGTMVGAVYGAIAAAVLALLAYRQWSSINSNKRRRASSSHEGGGLLTDRLLALDGESSSDGGDDDSSSVLLGDGDVEGRGYSSS